MFKYLSRFKEAHTAETFSPLVFVWLYILPEDCPISGAVKCRVVCKIRSTLLSSILLGHVHSILLSSILLGHASELPFVFNPYEIPGYKMTDAEMQLARTINRYWTNFAHTSDPNQTPSLANNQATDEPVWWSVDGLCWLLICKVKKKSMGVCTEERERERERETKSRINFLHVAAKRCTIR